MDQKSSPTSEFIKLLTGHQSSLRGFLVSLMPGSDAVNDILQDINVVLWEKRESFELGTNFQAWAFAIARNLVKAHWKRTKRDQSVSLNPDLADAISQTWFQQPVDKTGSREDALHHCLGQLSDSQRDLIHARYQSPESLETYASSLNRSPESIRVTLFRIREKLRDCINRRLALGEGGAL